MQVGSRSTGKPLPPWSIAAALTVALVTGLFSGVACERAPGHELHRIILITLDTTRTDRLGCYGYERDTSPNIDKLAADSVVYDEAFAPSSWTLPSHASLFTGKFTSSHGARYDPEGPLSLVDALEQWQAGWENYKARGLSEEETTLAQLLTDAGYVTGGVVAGPWMKRVFGLDRGFHFYDDSEISTTSGRRAEDVTDSAIRWIRKNRGRDFFLFLNYYDPHDPYEPPADFAKTFLLDKEKEVIALDNEVVVNAHYDAEILYMDHHLGRLFEQLKKLDLYDDSIIVVTADHGELLGEHYNMYGHGKSLYQEELHIPLIIKHSGGTAGQKRVDQPVQLVDLFTEILDMAGIPPPKGIQGGKFSSIKHPIIAELWPLPVVTPRGKSQSIIDLPYKFIWNSKGKHLLFNLQEDPYEAKNLLGSDPKRAENMEATLKAYIRQLPPPPKGGPGREVDKETQEALKSLGYVE